MSANRTLVPLACAMWIAGGFVGCGGGGGGGEVSSSPPTLVISSANSDAVGHAAAVAALSLPISWLSDSSVSLAGGPVPSASGGGSRFALLQAVRSRFSSAAGRSQSLEVMGTGERACNFGGTISGTVDDVDNNFAESPGDVETIQLNNCMVSPNEKYNGTVRAVVAGITDWSIAYNVTLEQLSYVTPNHSLTFNGSYVANESMAADGVQTTTLTVVGSLSVAVATHAAYNDTVTLADGFVVQNQFDRLASRSDLSAQGRVESALAGGSADESTSSNLTTSTAGMGLYPNDGMLKLQGKVGALTITVRSSASVCLDADTNDDGRIESTNTQSWDWLL